MSYEKVLCGSPESDSTEEPPPSLYSVEPEDSGLRLKKKQVGQYQRPLAETVNIEDQIMNDDEIARVNSAAGVPRARRNFEESEGRRKFENSSSGSKNSLGREPDDRRWIDLSLRNTPSGISSAFELDGRESVIKRRKLADSDESRKQDDSSALQCDETMTEEISRPIYHESYGSGMENDRGSSSERKPLPIYYYSSPHMLSQGGGLNPHVVRADFRSELGRPEQQVPVAGSPNMAEQRSGPYGLHGTSGLQFMRPGLSPAGVAVVPNLGPVRVVDEGNGMYYAIPMGAESSQYESLAPSFIPVGNILSSDASQAVSSADLPLAQDKALINTQKLFASSLHRNTASPSSSSDDHKSSSSPGVRSEHGSPAPAPMDDVENKGSHMQKNRAKPRPPGGRAEIKCDQCGKAFGSSSALAKHKLTHSDERRYVCNTCGKGFKRQDHLNGHMVTHRDKKPYECSFADCDKSYCDMRSLRRHRESQHPEMAGANSSGAPNNRKPAASGVSGVEQDNSPRNSYKPMRVKPVKEKGPTGDLLQGECESGKSSGRSTPGSVDVKTGDAGTGVPSRQHNSDSFSSAASDDVGDVPGEQKATEPKHHGGQELFKPKSAADFLKQAAVRAQEQRNKQAGVGGWPEHLHAQHPYMVYHHEGMPYQQWYPATVYSQDPHVVYQYHPSMVSPQVYQFGPSRAMHEAQNVHSQGMLGRAAAENELRNEMMKSSAAGAGAQGSTTSSLSSSDDVKSSVISQQPQATGGTPTDAMAIALAAAKDKGSYKLNKEVSYSVHPSGTQWQTVQFADSPSTYENSPESARTSMGNVKSVGGGPGAVTDDTRTTHSDGEYEIVISHSRGTQCRNGVAGERLEPSQKKHGVLESATQATNYSHKDKTSDGFFRNPAEILPRRMKQRPRPEPLTIPASVSTAYHSNRPGSPHALGRPASPPYTPPPMLSPRSIFSHVTMAGNLTPRSGGPPQLPMTPNRLLLGNRSCRSSIDREGEDEPALPEPKINIGPQFQAEVPPAAFSKEYTRYDVHRATLVWNQLDERKRSRREEIESFLDMACSVAMIGGSSNKEYALHILHKCHGNVKDAVKLLLKKNAVGVSDPLHDYHYEGSSRWAAKERQTFRNSFRSRGKEFAELQRDVGNTKTVADCVEFYYLWKANHPEAVRGRTRYIDSDTEEEECDTGSETNSNPSLFECDFPHCNAKFVSRQALNGHIRVHGGSFMKPSEPRKRNRPPAPATSGPSSTTVVKKRKPSPAPAPPTMNEDGTLPEFVCKVCGRIFHKIKSRSAHMKTHVKRPDDDEKAVKH